MWLYHTIGQQYTYDAENRVSTVAGVTYYYDADGQRMEKSSGTKYWFGPGGEVLTEASLAGTINEEYVFFNGKRIARVDRPSGTVHYYFSDHLGSSSVITDAVGNVQERCYYFPYGVVVGSCTGSDPNHYLFTGKERDGESGLDNFGARYDASSLGRFMTPDPLMASGHVSDPQSWNRYAYALNNPLRFTDPTGMEVPQSCADNKKCQITVKLNVIWDKTANNGKGLTDKQKTDFQKNQIDKAVKDYAKSGIKLDVSYTEGSFSVDSNNTAHFTGLQSDAVNVVASNQTIDGSNESGMTKSGTAVALVNVNGSMTLMLFPSSQIRPSTS